MDQKAGRRVLYVDPSPFFGGAQHSLSTLLQFLDRSRVEPLLFGSAGFRSYVGANAWWRSAVPVPERSPRLSRYLAASLIEAARLTRILRRTRPALVHANGRPAWLMTWIACHLSGVPMVWHARDAVGLQRFDRLAAALSDATIAPSHSVDRWLSPRCRRRVAVIPNGVDVERFRPGDRSELRRTLGLPVGRTLVGIVGQWEPWKRVDLFLEAFSNAARVNADLFAVVCGTRFGRSDSDVKAAYSGAFGEKGVTLAWQQDPRTLLTALDILVHPAEGEAFGRVVAEAMSCETPVIAARAGALPELVVDGVTGILATGGDRDAFSSALLRLAADPSLRIAMGHAGRERIVNEFSASIHARRIEEFYQLRSGPSVSLSTETNGWHDPSGRPTH